MSKKIITKKDIILDDLQQKDEKLFDFITGKEIANKPENREAKVPFEKRLVEEYGYPKVDIQPEFRIQKGSTLIGPADIAVFKHGKPHNQDYIDIIVETKNKDSSDGKRQLKSYMAPCKNVRYGVWFNGGQIIYLRTTKGEPKETFGIPRFGEQLGLPRKNDLKPFKELSKRFEIIHNYIYANEGLRNDETFDEILRLLFIKIMDEKDITSDFVQFGISDEEWELITDGKEDETKFKQRIENLFEKAKDKYSDIFRLGEEINLKTHTLAWVVGQLQDFSLLDSDIDVKGAAFQKFVYHHQRGERGEFFTPDPIIKLVIAFLKPKIEEKILDPACGTGRFLTETFKYIRNKYIYAFRNKDKEEKHRFLARDAQTDYAFSKLRGIDFNPTIAKVAKMRMVLMDDGHTGIFSANSLESWDSLQKIALDQEVKGKIGPGEFDLIMTNPPFGSKGKVDARDVLENFDLGHKWKFNKENSKWEKQDKLQNSQVPDILFIERCLDFLKDNGKMAIVLPDGDLTNSTLGYVRQYIKNQARILAVVSLPKETFIPSGAGVKTSVIFLQKLLPEELEKLKKKDYPVFFGIIEKIGHDGNKNGTPIYKRDNNGEIILDKRGEVIIDEDVSEVVGEWEKFKKKNL